MSSANLDLVRSILAAWERGDFSSAEWADADIEFVLADGPDYETARGLRGMAEAWRGTLGIWEQYRTEADDVRELDGDRVLALVRYGGRGKTSGLETARLGQQGAALFHVRDGVVTRLVAYLSSERAHSDLGLAPERSGDRPEADGPPR
jgi:ketosteroid isomerase-like protein